MKRPDYITAGYNGIAIVDDLGALTPFFGAGISCKVLRRRLSHDFNALAEALGGTLPPRLDGKARVRMFDREELRDEARLMPGPAREAAEFIAARDMHPLSSAFRGLHLRVVETYGAGARVHRFHADAGPVLSCTYAGAVTEYVQGARVLRAEKNAHNELSYVLAPNAPVLSLANGDLALQAGLATGGPYGAFIHRAPAPAKAGSAPRLVLIGFPR